MAVFQKAECHHIETRFPVPVPCLTHVKSNDRAYVSPMNT